MSEQDDKKNELTKVLPEVERALRAYFAGDPSRLEEIEKATKIIEIENGKAVGPRNFNTKSEREAVNAALREIVEKGGDLQKIYGIPAVSQDKAGDVGEVLEVFRNLKDKIDEERNSLVSPVTHVDSGGLVDMIEDVLDSIEDPVYQIRELERLAERAASIGERAEIYKKIGEIKEGASHSVSLKEVEDSYDRLLNSLNFTGNPEQRIVAAKRWLKKYETSPEVEDDMKVAIRTLAEVKPGEKELGLEDKKRLVAYCLESVFVRNANSGPTVYNSLFNVSGWLYTELGWPLDKTDEYREAIKRVYEELGLDNWISVRNVVSEWNTLKKVVDITPGDLRASLFMPEYTEMFFAGYTKEGEPEVRKRTMLLPGETEEKDIQIEVSNAMKVLKDFFDGNEYWNYVSSPWERKADLYAKLKLNVYVGEVAFGMLMSNLILTESKGTGIDPFLMMVNGSLKRKNNYKVDVMRSPEVRGYVQTFQADQLESGKGNNIPSEDEIVVWLASNYPNRLIPTGISSEAGLRSLEEGNWLLWRVKENRKSGAERAVSNNYELQKSKHQDDPENNPWIIATKKVLEGLGESEKEIKWYQAYVEREIAEIKRRNLLGPKGRLEEDKKKKEDDRSIDDADREKKRKEEEERTWKAIKTEVYEMSGVATDTEIRIEEMKTALELLSAIKEAIKSDSDLDKMAAVKSKTLIHWLTSMKAAGWVTDDDMISQEYCLGYDGGKQSVDQWVSMVTGNVCKTFIYAHSIADFKNPRPLEMKMLAEKAEQLLSMDVQKPQIDSYLWTGKESGVKEKLILNRLDYVDYVAALWDDCYDVIEQITKREPNPDKFPKWWGANVSAPEAVVEVAKKADKQIAEWGKRARRFK